MAGFLQIRQAANTSGIDSGAIAPPPVSKSWQDGWFTGSPPQDRLDRTVTAVMIAFSAVATTVFLMRVSSRAYFMRTWTVDDWLMSVGVLGMIGYVTGMSINISHGLGQHVWNLPESHSRIKGMLQQSLVCQLTYTIAMGFIKISFVYQLLKIIPTNRWRKVMFAYIIFLALYYLAATLSLALNCLPTSYSWRRLEFQWNPNMDPKDMPKGKCLDLVALQVSSQAVGLITDLICWIFPMRLVSRLALPPREKYSLLGVFMLGGLAVTACILRLHRLTRTKDITVQRDPPFGQAMLSMWSVVEIATAVICACLPTCRPILKKIFPRLLSYSEESRPAGRGAEERGLRPPPQRASELLQSYSSSIAYDEENRLGTPLEEKMEVEVREGK